MKLPLCFVFAIYLMMAMPVSAHEINEIELKDGSVILAEVVALEGNNFTLHSDTLGTFQLERSKIKSIRQRGQESTTAADGKGASSLANDQIKVLQEKIVSNKDTLDTILSLQDDPDFKAVLEDPEFMKAATSGDISALMANPKFMKLLSKPEIQDIGKRALQ
jgi:hypothetical protein